VSAPVSVVIGLRERTRALGAAIAAFAREAETVGAEVLIVDGSGGREALAAAAPHANVRVIEGTRGALMPVLWSEGIRATQGDVIALSIASMTPDAGWLARACEILAGGGWAAVGGAIENAASASPVHWAIYFARYSAYALPFVAHEVDDLPADNAAYRRDALAPARDLVERAFWEPPIHARMRAAGQRLLLDPALVVRHHGSFGLAGFAAQRFAHGRHHAAAELAGAPLAARLAKIARAPLVPLVLTARVAQRVLARRRLLAQLIYSKPVLLFFFSCWALGEAVGAALGDARAAEADRALAPTPHGTSAETTPERGASA
jgi:hypothetical protein